MHIERTAGTLPSNTVTNPKEHVKAISLRSGRTYEEPKVTNAKQDEVMDNEDSKMKEAESEMKEVEQAEKTKENERASKFKKSREQLHINIPLIEALEQMPKYAKFLKDIISKKRKLEYEIVMLTEESSAILQKKLPPKLKDPGSFTIPCTIGKSYFDRALCDVGASINLMPLSVFRKLGLGEADFIVLDMDEDEEIPLILGRPFLATERTLIDV
ncbi:uncharacterized protein LOC136063037 [Quercus suber]|uniref:uncharacterized protein LOC136063037 n=1 Tax=Quercus suber TaxID=58331 RepID=UPI0032DFA308